MAQHAHDDIASSSGFFWPLFYSSARLRTQVEELLISSTVHRSGPRKMTSHAVFLWHRNVRHCRFAL